MAALRHMHFANQSIGSVAKTTQTNDSNYTYAKE
jgi:hypothetical protein